VPLAYVQLDMMVFICGGTLRTVLQQQPSVRLVVSRTCQRSQDIHKWLPVMGSAEVAFGHRWQADRLLVNRHTIVQHRRDNKAVAVPTLIAPLGLVVQAIRPKVSASTTNHRSITIPATQQRNSSRPVAARAVIVECLSLTHAECVSDLVQRRPLCLVGSIRAKAEVAIVARFGGRHTWRVLYCDYF
jgi:hypothetical protein